MQTADDNAFSPLLVPMIDRRQASKDARCIAAVIAYNPAPDFTRLVATLLAQFTTVAVIDNGDAVRTARLLAAIVDQGHLVHVRNDGNLGIGSALNQALELARSLSQRWVVTFDHDSLVQEDYVATLFRNNAAGLYAGIAVMGPVWRRLGGKIDFAASLHGSATRHVDVPSVITSGSCVDVEIADAIGNFDETLFIDSVDQEYCLRATSRGYRVIVDRELVMEHRLGDESEVNLLGRRLILTNHSPVRRYYIARNKCVLWRRYLLRYPRWVATDAKWYVVETLKVSMFESHRLRKLAALLIGHLHALRGIRSRIPAATARLLTK